MNTIAELNAGALAGATHLKISQNLTEFPTKIFELAETLETLDLSGNKLSELPAEFACLSKLKILFLSDNSFEIMPSVIAACPALSMIGFKANKIHTVLENALPISTRWLILTDNEITALPESMGALVKLQKLMLAGNRLTALPASMDQCRALELVRISANQFKAMPEFLLQLPKLAWVAFSGNPFCKKFENEDLPQVSFTDLSLSEELGQGASGVISKAAWVNRPQGFEALADAVAVKKFKGEVTSDGYPQDELSACMAAGDHPNLVKLVAQIKEPNKLGLVMGLIDSGFSNLGQPPTLQSCTRDHFNDEFLLSTQAILKLSRAIACTMLHLHDKGIAHGDLYAHNILINEESDVLLGDFGAASNYASIDNEQAKALQSIEVRAFGCLLEDLLGCSCDSDTHPATYEALVVLKKRCTHAHGATRPTFAEVDTTLGALEVGH